MTVLGDRIRERRLALGLSQSALASELGVTAKAVSGWESGRRSPHPSLLLQLATTLKTSTSYLLGETDDPAPYPGGPKPFPSTSLAARLKERREAAGWTRGEVATYFHLPTAILDRWESGEVIPSEDMLMRLAAFYRTTKDYLIGKIDDPSPLHPVDVSGPDVVVADFKGNDPLPSDLPIDAEEEYRILMDYLRMKYGRKKEVNKREES